MVVLDMEGFRQQQQSSKILSATELMARVVQHASYSFLYCSFVTLHNFVKKLSNNLMVYDYDHILLHDFWNLLPQIILRTVGGL